MTSTIIDLIIRIKNGYMAGKQSIEARYSKLNVEVLKILKREGYIADYNVIDEDGKQDITIDLQYNNDKPVVTGVRLYSKPGQRIYRKLKDVDSVLGGLGISIITTSHGVMTDKEARHKKIGGEVICSIW